MAVTLKLQQVLKINGFVIEGSPSIEQEITLATGQLLQVLDKVVPDDYGSEVLWTAGEGGMTAYTHGFLFSDQDVWVELKTDNATPEYVLLEVKANILTALPAKAGGDSVESLDAALLVDGTDYDDVARIEVQRNAADGVGDAIVDLFLFA